MMWCKRFHVEILIIRQDFPVTAMSVKGREDYGFDEIVNASVHHWVRIQVSFPSLIKSSIIDAEAQRAGFLGAMTIGAVYSVSAGLIIFWASIMSINSFSISLDFGPARQEAK